MDSLWDVGRCQCQHLLVMDLYPLWSLIGGIPRRQARAQSALRHDAAMEARSTESLHEYSPCPWLRVVEAVGTASTLDGSAESHLYGR